MQRGALAPTLLAPPTPDAFCTDVAAGVCASKSKQAFWIPGAQGEAGSSRPSGQKLVGPSGRKSGPPRCLPTRQESAGAAVLGKPGRGPEACPTLPPWAGGRCACADLTVFMGITTVFMGVTRQRGVFSWTAHRIYVLVGSDRQKAAGNKEMIICCEKALTSTVSAATRRERLAPPETVADGPGLPSLPGRPPPQPQVRCSDSHPPVSPLWPQDCDAAHFQLCRFLSQLLDGHSLGAQVRVSLL